MARRGRLDWLGVALFGTVSATAFGLGTWQLQRYQWKVDLVAQRKNKLEQVAVPFSSSSREAYERVVCKGTFDYPQSMLIGPRTPPVKSPTSVQSMAPSGYVVVTPFHDKESGATLLVNRGWIPRNQRELAFQPMDDGEATFEGVIGVEEKAGTFTPQHATGEQTDFFALDTKMLAQAKGLPEEVVLVDVIGGKGPLVTKSVESMQTFKVDPMTHIGYAGTWYGLSAVGLFMIKKRFFR